MATIIRFPVPKPAYTFFDPPNVLAPSFTGDGSMVELEISKRAIEKFAEANLRIPMLELWSHLVGVLPPLPGAFKMEADTGGRVPTSIAEAHAIFKGVCRPYGSEDDGGEVLVYVISTILTVGWSGVKDRMACVASFKNAPKGTVLTVQVRPASALQPTSAGVWGTITKWEFVGESAEHPGFPEDYDTRYNERLWHR